jgi:hypothetical protein
VDGVEVLQAILKKGVKLYTTTDGRCYSYDDPSRDIETLLMISLIAQRANEESEIKSKRRKSAWDKAKENAPGQVPFNKARPPYGLRYDEAASSFVIQEDEAKEIREIFRLLKYMGVSNAIKEVNSYSKRKWTNRHVIIMIDTQYPVGVLKSQRRNQKGKKEFVEYIEGYYPRIVAQVDFNDAILAMRSRKDRKNYGNATYGNTNIFRHVVFCGGCGNSLIFEKQKNQKGNLFLYFNCFTRKELRGACDQRFRFDLAFGSLAEIVHFLAEGFKFARAGVIQVKNAPPSIRPKPVGNGTAPIKRITLSETESAAFKSAREGFDSFGNELRTLFSSGGRADDKTHFELDEKQQEILEFEAEYVRLKESIANYKGVIPDLVMGRAVQLEQGIQAGKRRIDELYMEIESTTSEITLNSYQDFIAKCMSEQGRLEMNRYFKSAKITFHFKFNNASRQLSVEVMREGVRIFTHQRVFPLHKPLCHLGVDNLVELYGVK